MASNGLPRLRDLCRAGLSLVAEFADLPPVVLSGISEGQASGKLRARNQVRAHLNVPSGPRRSPTGWKMTEPLSELTSIETEAGRLAIARACSPDYDTVMAILREAADWLTNAAIRNGSIDIWILANTCSTNASNTQSASLAPSLELTPNLSASYFAGPTACAHPRRPGGAAGDFPRPESARQPPLQFFIGSIRNHIHYTRMAYAR